MSILRTTFAPNLKTTINMSDELSYDERKEWAKQLYTLHDTTTKDIALQVGIEEAILRQWIKNDAWNDRKISLLISKSSQLAHLYSQLEKLSSKLSEDQNPNTKDMELYAMYTTSIKNLEGEPTVSNIIEVFDLFAQWLRRYDLLLAQKLIVHLDAFLNERIAA
jgi:transposase-like protein